MCDYEAELKKSVVEFKRLIFDHKAWTLKKNYPEVDIYSSALPNSKWQCYKSEALVHMPVERIMDTVHPTSDLRLQFDPNFSGATMLQELTQNSAIIRQTFKGGLFGLLSPRDSIDVLQFYKTDDYQYSIFSSVEHPDYPPLPGFVRGSAYPMGILAAPTTDPEISRVIAIAHMDFKLPVLIPQSVVESIMPSNIENYFLKLKSMEFESYEPLGKNFALCGWRAK